MAPGSLPALAARAAPAAGAVPALPGRSVPSTPGSAVPTRAPPTSGAPTLRRESETELRIHSAAPGENGELGQAWGQCKCPGSGGGRQLAEGTSVFITHLPTCPFISHTFIRPPSVHPASHHTRPASIHPPSLPSTNHPSLRRRPNVCQGGAAGQPRTLPSPPFHFAGVSGVNHTDCIIRERDQCCEEARDVMR